MRAIILCLVLASLAGCLNASSPRADAPAGTLVDAPVADQSRAADQYWMVWLHGSETRQERQTSCSPLPDHDLDAARRTLAYNPDRYQIQPTTTRAILALDHLRSEGCVAARGLVPDPAGPTTQTIGGFGPVTIAIHESGSIQVNGQTVPLGQALAFTYDQPDPENGIRSTGSFRIENLGAWDQKGLRPES